MYQQQQDPMRTVLGKLFPLMINSGNPFLMGAGMAGGLLSSLFGGQEQTQGMGGGVSRGQAPPESFVGPVDAGAGGSIPGVEAGYGDEGGEGPLAWGGGRQEVNPPLPSLPTRPGAAGYGAVPGIIPQGTGSPAAKNRQTTGPGTFQGGVSGVRPTIDEVLKSSPQSQGQGGGPTLANRLKSQMLTDKHRQMANPGLFQGSTLGKAQGMRPTLEEIIQSPPQSQKQGGPGAGYRATAGSGRSPQGGPGAGYGATAGGAPSQVDTSPSSDVNLSDENPVLKQISSLESRIAQLKESLGASSGSGSSEESSGPARDFDPRYDGEVYSNADLTMESMFSALGL